jgi:hypothetical protein
VIEQHRTMEIPGAGIMRDGGPATQHEEFPRYMTHPGYRRGKPDKEIKVFNEAGQEVGKRYMGGESIRFPPVLARTAAQRDYHLSQGYEDNGKSDAAAFHRLVAEAQPVQENYIPIEYPKFVFGKIVDNAEEAEARLIELNINADGSPREAAPAPSEPSVVEDIIADLAAETIEEPDGEEDEIAALEAKLAALKAKKAEPVVTLNEAALTEPLVMKEPVTDVSAPADVTKAMKNATRVAKIKATMARKKAEKAAKEVAELTARALQDEVQAEAGETE